jgi:uncharacterized protein YvpB
MRSVYTAYILIAAVSVSCKSREFNASDTKARVAKNVYEVEETTMLKVRPKMSKDLDKEEKCGLPKGTQLTLKQAPKEADDSHVFVEIENGLPENCSAEKFAASYIFEGHLLGNQQKRLTVPYFCQLNNAYEPWSTCNNTALAMVISYFGKKSIDGSSSNLPDQIYRRFGKANSIHAIRAVAQELGYKVETKVPGTIDEVKEAIDGGSPVIVGGDFTGSVGHFVVITGYDETGVWVHDPAGQWDQTTVSPGNGYGYNTCDRGVTGKDRHYSYRAMKLAGGAAGLYLDILKK